LAASPWVTRFGYSPKLPGLVKYGGSFAGAYLLRRGLFMPWELPTIVGKEMAAEGLRRLDVLKHIDSRMEPDPNDAFSRIATLESSMYMRNQLLRDTDWAGMAHSIEVRVPLIDVPLLRNIAPVLRSVGFGCGKNTLAIAPSKPLPTTIMKRKKTGFGTPVKYWLARSKVVTDLKGPSSLDSHWSRRWGGAVAELQRAYRL